MYVLVGTSDDSILPTIYVGEGDPVKNRLNQHYGKKDFWDWAVFFVAKDDSLNKAHVQHLEAELLRLAKEAKQCKLDNNQEPLAADAFGSGDRLRGEFPSGHPQHLPAARPRRLREDCHDDKEARLSS